MRGPLRALLRPIVYAWAASAAGATEVLPRPADSGPVHAPGPDSDSLLLLGSGPAVGWGVLHHDLGLAGALARALSHLTGRGVDVLVVADPSLTVRRASARAAQLHLERHDAVVVTLGINDAVAMESLTVWRRDVTGFVERILAGLPSGSSLFMVGIQPIRSIPVFDAPLGSVVDAHARAMNEITMQVCSQHPGAEFVPLLPLPPEPWPRYRSTQAYEVWAGPIAATMAPRMMEAPVTLTASPRHEDGTVNWRAVLSRIDGRRIDDLVEAAAGLAGVRSAAFSVIVGAHVWGVSLAGASPTDTPYEGSFTAVAVESRVGIVVPDASMDERFARSPLVAGEPHIRFFAGYPIQSPQGDTIGALCVFDTVPDVGGTFATGHLREFAQRIEAELRQVPSPPAG